jgi:hypothetical protein
MSDTRSIDQIRSDIAVARNRLTQDIEGFVAKAHPDTIKADLLDRVQKTVNEKVTLVKNQVVDEAGIRWDRIGTAVLVVAAVGVTALTVRGVVKGLKKLF